MLLDKNLGRFAGLMHTNAQVSQPPRLRHL
jgi:hypothetical protein